MHLLCAVLAGLVLALASGMHDCTTTHTHTHTYTHTHGCLWSSEGVSDGGM